nr:T9SS type A sorting domain-containing protein [candidate division Zixibacteria bacterium]
MISRSAWSNYIFMALICLVVSTGHAQDLVWQHHHGGVYNENGYAGLETGEGGYLILGNTYSYGAGGFDLYLLKISAAGDTLWTRTIGGIDTDYGYDVVSSGNDGYVLVGSTRSFGSGKKDVYLVCTDSLGSIVWSKTYGGSEDDEGRSVRRTGDHGYIICGTSNSWGAGYSDIYLVKTDSLGNLVWSETFGGTGGETGYAVRQTIDGGYIAVGATGSFGTGYSSVYAVRANASGDSLWATTYGGSGADLAYSVEIAGDQGYLIIGATSSSGSGYTDGYLIKTDANGVVLWEKTYGGTGDDRLYHLCRALDGTYLLTGTTDSYGAGKIDIYLVRTDPAGDTIWTETVGGSNSDYGRMVFQDQLNDYLVIGESYSYSAGGTDVFIVKVGGETTPVLDDDPGNLPSGYKLVQNYPNPFNSTTSIEYALPRHADISLTIFNLLGQVVREYRLDRQRAGVHIIQWNGTDQDGYEVASGIYFYRLSAGEYTETRKMLIIK